ncbi:MAG: hypothetical protein QOG27_764, partial [Verrucomicrobiota bacterium]
PGVDHFVFAEPLAQSELLHQLRQKICRSLPAIGAGFVGRQSTPLSDNGGAQ